MKFLITGDSLFSSHNLKETIHPEIQKYFWDSDGVFTNAEFVTPRTSTAPAAGRGYQTSVRPEILKEFAQLNIRYVGFANNHTGDYGIEGILDTLEEAREAGLYPLGIGRDLYEARKPVFLDTKDGRIAIITVDITRSEIFAASKPGNGVPGRPGVNPLRWGRHYVVSPEDMQKLREIGSRIGIIQSMEEGKRIETFKEESEKICSFGSLFEGYLTFEEGEIPGVKTFANEKDQSEILRYVSDASKRSDFVFVNLHTHEGETENWYSDYAASFVEQFARLAVEAGADCVFGHGAHFARGIELYRGKPIFYNLGSLLMQFEAGESIISPEMFEAYGYRSDEVPSTLHRNRVKDSAGNWIGFASDNKFGANFMVQFDLNRDEKRFDYDIIPLDLRLRDEYVTNRGIPVPAKGEFRTYLIHRLNEISNERYHTAIIEKDHRLILEAI